MTVDHAPYTRRVLEPSLDHAAAVDRAPGVSVRFAALGRGLDRSLALLAGLAFASNLIVAMMLPVLPLFARELGATPRMLAAMVAISALAGAAGQLVGGFVSERVGARRLLPAGLVGYGAASLLTSIASSAVPVVALRGLSGLGSGAYLVGERLYIRQVVDRARLAFANSLVQATAAVGVVVGPLLGGALAEDGDLRSPIIAVTVLSVVVAALALLLPSRHHRNAAAEPAAGAPVRVDRTGLGILLVANLCFVTGYGSFITTFTPFATDALRWSTTEIGLAFALFGLGNVAGAPVLGAAADRLGRRWVGTMAMVPIVAFAAALILPAPSVVLLMLAFLAGCGVAGFTASWYALLGVATGARGGGLFGTVAGVSSLGIIIGALAAGELWERIDVRAAMVVTVVAMALAGLALAAYRGERRAAPAQVAGWSSQARGAADDGGLYPRWAARRPWSPPAGYSWKEPVTVYSMLMPLVDGSLASLR